MRHSMLVALLALTIAGAVPASAQEEGWSYGLWSELMSPYCPGRSLADCPSEQAEQLRSWIVTQEESGRSEDQVLDELYQRFGNVVRAAPHPSGIGLAAYLVPLLAFLAGGVLVWLFLRRRGAAAPDPDAGGSETDPELLRAIDEELGA